MIIHRPQTASEAVQLRYASPDTTAYLAGGTDDLRLGGAAEGKELIDINALGFDTIEECFSDLTGHIHALETGLSSDPPMNWRLIPVCPPCW